MSKSDLPPSAALEQEAWRIPVALPPEKEQQILARVRRDVLSQYLSDDQPEHTRGLGWLWWTTGSAFAAAMCVALVFWGPWAQTQPLQQQGLQQLQATAQSSAAHTTILQAATTKPGFIKRANRWRIDTTGATRLALHKGTVLRQRVELQNGFVKVHVVPHTMKRFAVTAAGYRVEVKGTRFTVERRPSYVKVEVWRGKVVFHTPSATQRAVTKGQGCRADLTSGQLSCYPLPPSTSMAASRRLQWLGKQHPDKLQPYVNDLAHNPRWSKKQRASFLREAVELSLKAHRWRDAIKSNRLLASLKVNDSNQALVDAGMLCRRHLRHNMQLCQGIFKQCLHQCKEPTWKEQSLGMLAFAAYQQAKRNDAKRAASELIHKYLKRYPQGSWQKNLRRLLVRQAISKGQSCQRARRHLAKGDAGEAWFIKRCPSKR